MVETGGQSGNNRDKRAFPMDTFWNEERIMEKICIVKLRKKMSQSLPNLAENRGQEDDDEEDPRHTGLPSTGRERQISQEASNGKQRDGSREISAPQAVSLMLTREQMRQLQSNPALALALRDKTIAGCRTVQHNGEAVVIKFEFDALPLRLLTVDEVAQMLRISKASLNRAIQDGEIKSYKFGRRRRFRFDDVLSFLEAHQERADGREQASESGAGGEEID
jgi:excisionase family DNA binding protein